MWLYRAFYIIFFLIYLPKLTYELWKKKNFRAFISRIFPNKIPPLSDPRVPLIWIHSVSLGETVAVQPIIEEFLRVLPHGKIVTSHATEAGVEAAKKFFPGAHAHVYLPFESKALYDRLLANISSISLLVYSEGDVWPLFTRLAKKKGAFVTTINGKLSEKSFNRYRKIPYISSFVFSDIDLLCLQNELFKKRYLEIGVNPSKLLVTGTTKADREVTKLSQEEENALRSKLGCVPDKEDGRRLVVIASSHDPEEFEITQRLSRKDILQSSRLLIVPRHSHRFISVYENLSEKFPGVRICLLSQLEAFPHSDWDIVVVDKMGLLMPLYQIAYLSVVCGSFVSHVGGHNILEPASLSCPFFVGPYMHSQPLLHDSASMSSALLQVQTYDELADRISDMLMRPGYRNERAHLAFSWSESMKGAVERTVQCIKERCFSEIERAPS